MKFKNSLLVVVIFLFSALNDYGQDASMDALKSNFDEPGAAWRGKPFWSWNGDLEKEELIRQIHVMKEMGMGGYFMHSRTGLKTEYLGEKWFDLINACADEGEKLGMEAWLYDEDRWPSGTAGGMVTKNPEYRAKLLTMHVYDPGTFDPQESYEVLFSCRLDSTSCYEAERINMKEARKRNKDKSILGFFVREAESSSFYNGYTDVDRLNREATDYFIQITHEAYKKHSGDRMGTSIKGIFTDEPHRQGVMRDYVSLEHSLENRIFLPWTSLFQAEFQKRMGYDILDKLPSLFLQPEGEKVSPVKWQYIEVAQQLFLENWVQPITDWCEDNNLIFTGHFLHENNLTSQTAMQGSLMRSYEYMQVPGIDVLTAKWQIYWIAKQCQSVTRQFGQKFMLSELYAATGWEFDFAGHKYVGDWQALFGVNLRCHHLSWYTMEGQAKRDYPASILHQSTWYQDYDFVETYFARLGYMLSQGSPNCDVLVVNPVESVWSRIRQGWAKGLSPGSPDIVELEEAYADLFNALQENQIDFDYGDEDILMRHARVSTLPGGKAVLTVGEAAYTTVVLGKMTTIRSSTLDLLKSFGAAGGTIIQAGDSPDHMDAVPSAEPAGFLSSHISVPFEKDQIATTVRAYTSIPVEVIDPKTGSGIKDIYCQVRSDGDRTILVAMNMSDEKSYPEVMLKINAAGYVSEWDCESGIIQQVNANQEGQTLEIQTAFLGPEEHVYTITQEIVPGAIQSKEEVLLKEVPLSGPFEYILDEANLCVMDVGMLEVDGKALSGPMEILKIDHYLREKFDLPQRAGKMVQPWYKKKFGEQPEVKAKVRISFPFYVEEIPDTDLAFCMETPEEFHMSINGKAIILEEDGWWVDVAIRKFSLPKELLKKGENVLVQEFDFRDDLDLEALYLLGEFAVRLEGEKKILSKLPEKINVGDLTAQGLPFYTGRIRYIIPLLEDYSQFGQVVLEVPDYEAACIKVNPESPGDRIIAWEPNRINISESLAGKDELTLEAVLTRRNAFGPLHHTPIASHTAPPHFISTGERFTLNYVLYPGGIMKNPKLLIYK